MIKAAPVIIDETKQSAFVIDHDLETVTLICATGHVPSAALRELIGVIHGIAMLEKSARPSHSKEAAAALAAIVKAEDALADAESRLAQVRYDARMSRSRFENER